MNDADESIKKPKEPSSIKPYETVSKYRTRRNVFHTNESLYSECYPTVGNKVFAEVDEKNDDIKHKSFDLSSDSDDDAPKKRRRHKKKGDKWESVQQSLKEIYGDSISDD